MPILMRFAAKSFGQGNITSGNDSLCEMSTCAAVDHQITSQLFLKKQVVALVIIKGIDDVLAIKVDFRNWTIGIVSGSIGVSNDVQPMAAPPLAVMP